MRSAIARQATARSYTFGRFRLEPSERRLLMNGAPAELGPRAFEVLVALVERAGRLVSKDELLALAWPNLVVEENNLQVQVSTLRKLLGHATIATVPGQGYRFTVETEASSADSSRPRHNLPQPLTSFIGQEENIVECARAINEARLLTMIGVGGCGKTRLAIRIAETALPQFPGGAWFIDLASVAEPDRIASCVANTLGIREKAEEPLKTTVCKHLSTDVALLVLDNCEHLLSDCATFASDLLANAAGLHVLATSRESLGVPGERILVVPPLSLPPPASRDPAVIEGSAAVRLFVERARLLVGDFALDKDRAPSVAEICRRLDGIPLAIELAAAWVKLLSVEQIRTNLDDRFRLLTGTNKAVPRHQTLRDTIEWSYAHLVPEERQTFRRLAVFAGGWSVPAVTAIVGAGGDELVMAATVGRLVDKSLIVVQRNGVAEPRCRMLETVREYAQQRLLESGEAETLRAKHLDYFLAFAETTKPKLRTDEAKAWLDRLDAELPNVLEAHAWSSTLTDGDEIGLRFATALAPYFTRRGLFALGRSVIGASLARKGADQPTMTRSLALRSMGQIASLQGAGSEARRHFAEGLHIARQHADLGVIAVMLLAIGMSATSEGDCTVAREHLEESLKAARKVGDDATILQALNGLGEICRIEHNSTKAKPLYEEAMLICRRSGFVNMSAAVLLNLAVTEVDSGHHAGARDAITEAASFIDTSGNQFQWGTLLDVAVGLVAACGDHAFAARMWGASEATHARFSWPRDVADERFVHAWMARAKAALDSARFHIADAEGRTLGHEQAVAELRTWLERRQTLSASMGKPG